MSYRQSSFDPRVTRREVHPILRPFDRWQWLGVVTSVLAGALVLLWFADHTGVLRTGFTSMAFTIPFILSGGLLLRRDPALPAGELGERKWQLVVILAGLALLPLAFLP